VSVPKNYSYCLYIHGPKGTETVLKAERDIMFVRRVAASRGRKLKGGRTMEITRDGKVLRGGRFALDTECFRVWLEINHNRTHSVYWDLVGLIPPKKKDAP